MTSQMYLNERKETAKGNSVT